VPSRGDDQSDTHQRGGQRPTRESPPAHLGPRRGSCGGDARHDGIDDVHVEGCRLAGTVERGKEKGLEGGVVAEIVRIVHRALTP
jgi:hypothetical protein